MFASLPELWLPPSNFAVTAVLGWWKEPSTVTVVDPAEVHAVLRVPIDELLDPQHRVTVVHPIGYSSPGFMIGDDKDLILWGFTAGLVNKLFDHVGLDAAMGRVRGAGIARLHVRPESRLTPSPA